MKVRIALTAHDGFDWSSTLSLDGRSIGAAWTRGDRVCYDIPLTADFTLLRRQARAAGEDSVPCYLNDLATAAAKVPV